MNVRHLFNALLLVAIGSFGIPASALVFSLDCIVASDQQCGAPFKQYGTVTIDDDASNANNVKISINLINTAPPGGGTEKLVRLFLNIDDTLFPPDPTFTATPNVGGVDPVNPPIIYNKNAVDFGPYTNGGGGGPNSPTKGHFDLDINLTGQTISPFSIVLSAGAFNLDPAMFNFATNVGAGEQRLFVGAHIRGCDENGRHCGEASFPDDIKDGANGVPEPATLALLSFGMAGLGFSRRRSLH